MNRVHSIKSIYILITIINTTCLWIPLYYITCIYLNFGSSDKCSFKVSYKISWDQMTNVLY